MAIKSRARDGDEKLIAMLSVGLPDSTRERLAERLIEARIEDDHLKVIWRFWWLTGSVLTALVSTITYYLLHR